MIGTELIRSLSNHYDLVSIDTRDPIELIEGVEYLRGDISDISLPNGTEGVVHLAAVSRVINAENDPFNTYKVNVIGTTSVIEKMSRLKPKPWLIYGSSREVYGENQQKPVGEDQACNPINHYGISKVAAENITKIYARDGGKVLSLRFSNVYGGIRDHLDRVVPKFIHQAISEETITINGKGNTFDFTHVKDTVEGICLAVKHLNDRDVLPTFHESLNICTRVETSLEQLASIIIEYTRSSSEVVIGYPRHYDVGNFVGNYDRAKKLLGYSPSMDITTGVRNYIDFLEKTMAEVVS